MPNVAAVVARHGAAALACHGAAALACHGAAALACHGAAALACHGAATLACHGAAALALVVAASLAGAARAQTTETLEKPGFELEHVFGFADASDIGAKGDREIEIMTIGGFGAIGVDKTVDNETSFRYGVTDTIRLSFGTLTDFYRLHDVPGLTNRTQVDFSGLIGELRVMLVDHDEAPFGLTLSFNPQWRQFDPASGATSANYAFPVTLIADKAIIPNTLYMVTNLVYTPSFVRVGWGRGNDDAFTAIIGASYALTPNLFAGGEIRHENLAENGLFTDHALFVGPNLYYRFSDRFNAKIAWAIQIPDIGASGLDLAGYQKHQVEVQFAVNF